MQSQPLATPQNISTPSTPQEPLDTSQHGLPLEQQLHPADQHRRTQGERVEQSDGLRHRASSPASSSGDDGGLSERLDGLNVKHSSSQRAKASFQRIADYENATSPSPPKRTHSDGPAFQIVKRKGQSVEGPQLQEFPNGKQDQSQRHTLCGLSNLLQRS